MCAPSWGGGLAGDAGVTVELARPIVFDLRDRSQTGLGRVARETVRAYRACFPNDAVTVLEAGGGRYSWRAQREWPALRRAHPEAVWVFFHWDVPLVAPPPRSVVYLHDLITLRTDLGHAGWLKRQVTRQWVGHALRHAGRVVTVSQATAEALKGLGSGFAVTPTVIPNGVSAALGGPWEPQDYLLTVGDDRPYKNLAMARAVSAALGVRHAHASGVDDATLRALYRGARVVLMPSRAEGFGLPLLEAFAAGAPVVASDIPSHREIGGGLATLVPPMALDQWTEAVRACLEHPGDPALRQAHAATFTWERAARQLRDVIRSISA